MSNWTLFSNHGHVLICLTRNPEARLRDVASDVGITERAVQKIVRDLQEGGMVSITKNGRRNSYRIHTKKTLRHDLEADCTLKDLIKIVNKKSGSKRVAKQEVVDKEWVKPPEPESKKNSSTPKESKSATKKSTTKEPVTKKPKKQKQDNPGNSGQSDVIEKQQGWLF